MTHRPALLGCLLAVLGASGCTSHAGQAGAPGNAESAVQQRLRSYIVQLADPPLAAYGGGLPGLPGTRPAPGQQLDAASPAARAYTAYLSDKQRQVLDKLGIVAVSYRYVVAMNGFAARLTDQQVDRLRATEGVLSVQPSEIRQLDGSTSPSVAPPALERPGPSN